jgi:hypothetical protein
MHAIEARRYSQHEHPLHLSQRRRMGTFVQSFSIEGRVTHKNCSVTHGSVNERSVEFQLNFAPRIFSRVFGPNFGDKVVFKNNATFDYDFGFFEGVLSKLSKPHSIYGFEKASE